jgi:hypothetical protein
MSPLEFLAEVEAELTLTFAFTVREGKLSWKDPYSFTRGEKSVEFHVLGSDVLMAFLDNGKLGETTALLPTRESVEQAVTLISAHFRPRPDAA